MLSCKFPLHLNYFFISLFLIDYVVSDVFSSLVDLENVLETEKEIPSLVEEYIKAERERLQEIKKLAQNFKQSQFIEKNKEDTYLDNPINIFHLVKRLNVDTHTIMHLMNITKINDVIKTYRATKKDLVFPNKDDFIGVVTGFNRLLSVYNINVSNLAKGEIIPGNKSSKELTALDCYDIAQQLFDEEKYEKSIQWFEEARYRLTLETTKNVDMESLYDFLSYTYFMLGYSVKAVEILGEYLEQDPNNERLLTTYSVYESQLEEEENKLTPKVKDKSLDDYERNFPHSWNDYIKLCQQVLFLDHTADESHLTCYYSRKQSSYLKLQPAKMEDVSHNPFIVIFHDVINEKEIEIIIKLSTPKLTRASIINHEGKSSEASYRISKSGWLNDNEHSTLSKISKRIEELTGLETFKAAESMQVVNYGIGGHYEPHVDYDERSEHPVTQSMGDRLATFLLYLSEVSAGGGTVFPQLNIGVHPKKGSAIFWYNLFKNGNQNSLMQHAACPVLVGNKWVANKWIHEFQQEFRRPCGLRETSLFDESPVYRFL